MDAPHSAFRPLPRDAGDFRAGAIAWDILHFAGRHGRGSDAIDLTRVEFLRPAAVACLAAVREFASAPIVAPADGRAQDHLSRLGLIPGRSDAVGSTPRATNVPLERLTDNAGLFATRAMVAWESELGSLSAGVRHGRATRA